jgi:zeaxanthin glucosyltransferase
LAHFGAICFPGTGHLNPMLSLLRELQRRGHRATLFQIEDLEGVIRAAGIEHCTVGAASHPRGTLTALDRTLSRLKGFAALRFTLARLSETAAMMLRDAPAAVRDARVDAMIVDQAELAGSSIAEHLGIPFVTVAFFPPVLRDPCVPPFNVGWRYGTGLLARLRNAAGNAAFYGVARATFRLINQQRNSWELPRLAHPDDLTSRTTLVTQMPQALDFPRRRPAPNLHHTGPFVDPGARKAVEFPWERLDAGRPLVYASMGSQQNGLDEVFRRIAAACAGLKIQLVLSLGGGMLDAAALGPLAGDPIVVRYAPQLDLLRGSALTITHAGLNTVLESLSVGVPMVAIPVANDQPGVAARVEWRGAGRAVPLGRATVPRLRAAIDCVLSDPRYRAAAVLLQRKIREADGLNRAANLVEAAVG